MYLIGRRLKSNSCLIRVYFGLNNSKDFLEEELINHKFQAQNTIMYGSMPFILIKDLNVSFDENQLALNSDVSAFLK